MKCTRCFLNGDRGSKFVHSSSPIIGTQKGSMHGYSCSSFNLQMYDCSPEKQLCNPATHMQDLNLETTQNCWCQTYSVALVSIYNHGGLTCTHAHVEPCIPRGVLDVENDLSPRRSPVLITSSRYSRLKIIKIYTINIVDDHNVNFNIQCRCTELSK